MFLFGLIRFINFPLTSCEQTGLGIRVSHHCWKLGQCEVPNIIEPVPWNHNELIMIRTMSFALSSPDYHLHSIVYTLYMAVLQNTFGTSPILNPFNTNALCLPAHTSSQCTKMDKQMLPCARFLVTCGVWKPDIGEPLCLYDIIWAMASRTPSTQHGSSAPARKYVSDI